MKARSDWLIKHRISFAIYIGATDASVTSKEITQISNEAVIENTMKATKFGLAMFKGNGLSF